MKLTSLQVECGFEADTGVQLSLKTTCVSRTAEFKKEILSSIPECYTGVNIIDRNPLPRVATHTPGVI